MSQWPYRIAQEQRAIRALMVSFSVLLLGTACYDDNNNDYNNPTGKDGVRMFQTGNGEQ